MATWFISFESRPSGLVSGISGLSLSNVVVEVPIVASCLSFFSPLKKFAMLKQANATNTAIIMIIHIGFFFLLFLTAESNEVSKTASVKLSWFPPFACPIQSISSVNEDVNSPIPFA